MRVISCRVGVLNREDVMQLGIWACASLSRRKKECVRYGPYEYRSRRKRVRKEEERGLLTTERAADKLYYREISLGC